MAIFYDKTATLKAR